MKPFPEGTTEHRRAQLTACAGCAPEAVETAEGAFLLPERPMQKPSALSFGTSPQGFTPSSPSAYADCIAVHLLAGESKFYITDEITQILKNMAEPSDKVEQQQFIASPY